MTDDRKNSNRRETFLTCLGLGSGLLLAGAAAAGMYSDPRQKHTAIWTALVFSGWAAVSWGSYHLARYRGYDGAVGCGILAIGFPIYLYLVHNSHKTIVYLTGFVFVVALPLTVLLALPKRAKQPGGHRRRRHRHHHSPKT